MIGPVGFATVSLVVGTRVPGADREDRVLDNAVWHSLAGVHRRLGSVGEGATRFEEDVAPFAALCDRPGPESWDELAELAGPGGTAVLLMPSPPPVPAGWEVRARTPGLQLVAAAVRGAPAEGAVDLGPADVAAMLDLVARTQPGPFRPRTVELGRYIGIRRDGELVAMAGERLRPAGYTEISAVCTDPAHQGSGLATALVRDLVGSIDARGEVAFLHVLTDNVGAAALYEHLGFRHRRDIEAVVLQAPGPALGGD